MQQKRWYSHSCIISCRYFPFQKMPPLFQPVPMFQHDHIRLINLYILLFQPYIKKTFCKKSKYSFFIYAAPGQINPFFQLEKNRKKPGAKGVSCYLVGLVTCSIIEFLPIFFTYGLVSYLNGFQNTTTASALMHRCCRCFSGCAHPLYYMIFPSAGYCSPVRQEGAARHRIQR